ncbi:amidohydrolase [SAR202 cluster bacterium AD-804-J14_MRT_500m]|nr:amidohydrolase [SAR202 cluster bacterium AD-804-J14_MRT_500m]
MEATMAENLVISSDSHVFEPPDLWTERIDDNFKSRAPYIKRVGEMDHLMIEGDQKLSGIGLVLGAGTRFEAPENISHEGRFDDVLVGAYEPEEHIRDMKIDGVAGELLYPSQGLFFYAIRDSDLLSAIFRTYNDWLAEFCATEPDRLKGVAMINLDDVQEGVAELKRCAKLGLVGAMIPEYPGHDCRYDGKEYEPLWATAEDLGIPLSLHTATNRAVKTRTGEGDSIQEASARANKVFWPSTSMCDMIFSGVFERHPDLKAVIVEFELAWAAHLVQTIDYTYMERQEEASYRFKDGLLPSDYFHNNVSLSFQEDPVGIRVRDVIGVDNMMWGSDYPHAESTFPKSREILDAILDGVPDEDRNKIVALNAAKLYNFDLAAIDNATS